MRIPIDTTMWHHDPSSRPAMSLIELLVVIAIVVLLGGLISAGVQAVRTTAARLDCQNRMKQLGLAGQGYHATHRSFPAGVAYPFAKPGSDPADTQMGISWQTSLLPYLEQSSLWQQAWSAHSTDPMRATSSHFDVASHPLAAFRCPTDARQTGQYPTEPGASQVPPWGLTNYLGVVGSNWQVRDGVLPPKRAVAMADITDGASNTLMIGERPTAPNGFSSSWYTGWGVFHFVGGQLMPLDEPWVNAPVAKTWCEPRTLFQPGKYDDPCHLNHFWSLHPGGANFAFADGSVRFLRYSAASVLPALATRAGEETLTGDW